MAVVHYVYEWHRMDLNLPYYVGKGSGKRAYQIKRNKHTDAVTKYLLDNGIQRKVVILCKFLTDKAAKEFEVERIAYLRELREHGILTNKTDGGEGVSGYKHGPQQLKKMSEKSKNKPKSKTHCLNISKATKGKPKPYCAGSNHWTNKPENDDKVLRGEKNGMYGKKGVLAPAFGRVNGPQQREAARKLCLSRTGENNPNYGKITPDDVKEKLSKSNRGKTRSEEAKQNMRKPRSEAGKAAIAASNRARAEKKRAEKAEALAKQAGD
jgi:hypothetical protein